MLLMQDLPCIGNVNPGCMCQVAYPELQKRKMERARHRQWRHEAVRAMQRHVKPMGSMLTETGNH